MAILTFEGRVENGQIQLPADVALPEHAKVYVVIPDFVAPARARVYSPRLAHPEQATDFVKEVIEVPIDAQL
jgi:hypothetical protein